MFHFRNILWWKKRSRTADADVGLVGPHADADLVRLVDADLVRLADPVGPPHRVAVADPVRLVDAESVALHGGSAAPSFDTGRKTLLILNLKEVQKQ